MMMLDDIEIKYNGTCRWMGSVATAKLVAMM